MNSQIKNLKKPDWLKKQLFNMNKENEVKNIIKKKALHTVCEEAHCPNRGECYSQKQATFLLMGNQCTRNCRFCHIDKSLSPLPLDDKEPLKIAETVKEMGLKYVVLTSVTRDDLEDGGAAHFSKTVEEIHKISSGINVEVLVPDFENDKESIDIILNSKICVFNHNLETVPRLYKEVRPMASYSRSLEVLKYVKKKRLDLLIKTGIMVGMGEDVGEVKSVMDDFCGIGGDIITIGQYLAPGKDYYPVKSYLNEDFYQELITYGRKIGIKEVVAGPFVRSSYNAEKSFFNFF